MNKDIFWYIHIPFCDQKCGYCRFASIWSTQKFQVSKYVHSLIDEVQKSAFIKSQHSLKSIYFWWGTPSVLEEQQMKKILDTMKNLYDFNSEIEITLETTPMNVNQKSIDYWNKLGINRVSMWIQTLRKKSLNEIWRGNKGDIINALDILEKWSIDNISIDFIIGLPYVELGEIKKDIEFVLENYDVVKHISVYMLEEYYSEDKIIETKYDKITYPDDWNTLWIADEDYLSEYIEIKEFLRWKWFDSYEISNFAKPWYECNHNKAYWNHSEIHAFWLWAYWYHNSARYRNSESFKEYYNREKIISEKSYEDDIFLEQVMFQLRTSGIEDKVRWKLDESKISLFKKDWYLKEEEGKIKLEDTGVLVMDYILKEII